MDARTWIALLWMTCAFATGAEAQVAAEPIKFETRHGFLVVVAGSAGRLEHLSCLVDTGATKTMVDERVARKLGLQRENRKAVNLERAVEVEWGRVDRLRVGNLEVQNFEVMIGDLRSFSEFGNGLDVVIGMDLLQLSEKLRIDYRAGTIALQLPAGGAPRESPKLQAMIIEPSVDGRGLHLLLDSGIQGMMLYEDRLRAHEAALKFENVTNAHESRVHGRSATLSAVRFGRKSQSVPVFLIERAPKELPQDLDGYVGTDALHAQWIEMDFVEHALRWE